MVAALILMLFALIAQAVAETAVERRDRLYTEYSAIPQTTKDDWATAYGATICH